MKQITDAEQGAAIAPMADAATVARFVALLQAVGHSPLSTQAPFLPRLWVWWHGGAAAVPFRRSRCTWLALGPPVAPPDQRAPAIAGFVAAARRAGARAALFGLEPHEAVEAGLRYWACAEDPICLRSRWLPDSPSHVPRTHLMRQVRRGARTVRIERTLGGAAEALGRPLLDAFIARQAMPPLGFAATPSLRGHPPGAYHWLAWGEQGLEGALVALPNAPTGTWLIESVFRQVGAPNGTTELLIDTALNELEGAERVSLGMLALHGPVPRLLRVGRSLGRSLYSFAGLASFRRRLQPDEVRVLCLAFPEETGALWTVWATAMAFVNGRPLHFSLRLLVRGPRLVLWLQAAALLPWTLALALLPWTLCFAHPASQRAWVAFDSLLVVALGNLAYRPRRALSRWLAMVVTTDVALTALEMLFRPAPQTPLDVLARLTTLLAPLCSAFVLWGTHRRLGRLER